VVRPDLITLRASSAAAVVGDVAPRANFASGIVEDVKFGGSVVHYNVNTSERTWQVTLQAGADDDLSVGTSVSLSWPKTACIVVPPA
jgi:TOBE domain